MLKEKEIRGLRVKIDKKIVFKRPRERIVYQEKQNRGFKCKTSVFFYSCFNLCGFYSCFIRVVSLISSNFFLIS